MMLQALSFLEKHGPILNVSFKLMDLSDTNPIQSLSEWKMCCYTTSELLAYLFSSRECYYKKSFIHPLNQKAFNSDSETITRDLISKYLPEIFRNLKSPSIIKFIIENVVEFESHIISILCLDSCVVIQSFMDRYSLKITQCDNVEQLLHKLARCFDDLNDIQNKLALYNQITHNSVSIDQYNQFANVDGCCETATSEESIDGKSLEICAIELYSIDTAVNLTLLKQMLIKAKEKCLKLTQDDIQLTAEIDFAIDDFIQSFE